MHEAAALNRESDRVKAAGRARNIASNMLAKLGAGGWGTIAVPASVAERAGASPAVRRPTRTRTRSFRRRSRRAWEGGTCAEGRGEGYHREGYHRRMEDWTTPTSLAPSPRAWNLHHPSRPPSEPDPTPVPTAAWAVPEEPGANEGIALAFRVPGGGRLQRRFRTTDAVGAVEAWLGREAGVDFAVHSLTVAFPRRRLTDRGSTLGECGVGDKTALSVESGR